MKTLGIFITTDRYPDYLMPLARAAYSQGVQVHIHFCGSGVRLVELADRLATMANISICKQSADYFKIHPLLENNGHIGISIVEMTRLIQMCDRHLFI